MRVVVRLIWFSLFLLIFAVTVKSAASPSPAAAFGQVPKGDYFFGMVVQVNYIREGNAHDPMVEIRLHHGDQTATVRLGPSSFLNEYGFALKEGEDLGVWMRKDVHSGGDNPVFIGLEITKGSRRLALRDDNGRPLW